MARKSSPFRGVSYHKASGKWAAQIWLKGLGVKYLGLYRDEIRAALAYDIYSWLYYHDRSRLNFPGSTDVLCPVC